MVLEVDSQGSRAPANIITRCGRAGEARTAALTSLTQDWRSAERASLNTAALGTPLTPGGHQWNCRPSVWERQGRFVLRLLARERIYVPNSITPSPLIPNPSV